jgi:hypothetical protein
VLPEPDVALSLECCSGRQAALQRTFRGAYYGRPDGGRLGMGQP